VTANLVVLSLGAGVQSTTLALLAVERVLPKPDAAIFADTGWEPKAVYEHLDRLRPVIESVGIPLYVVTAKDGSSLRERPEQLPVFVKDKHGVMGITGRQCTGDYKVSPIKRQVRALLGYPHPKPVPRSVWVEQWIGFSTDEIGRVRDRLDVNYTRPRHPLIELNMSRKDCLRFLSSRGWSTTKSACLGCPFHGNSAWRNLRDNSPEEWADTVAFDHALRAGGPIARSGMRGTPYLHRSGLPLDEAPIDHVTRREWGGRQVDLLDLIAEEGDPDGCSPYGCRNGEPAA
jgi:hypothetical protein